MNIIENTNAKIYDSKEKSYDVSVCIITYNKADYICETIESVLSQKTTCSYEIVVGDNNSSDGTQEILLKYWNKSPDKFTIILNERNLGLTKNIYNTMRKAKGKYIIILYGDDYWIKDTKLQKQYDYLEHNKKYIGVTSTIESRFNGEHTGIRRFPETRFRDKQFTLEDFLRGNDFPMAGLMFRNKLFSNEEMHFKKMLYASQCIDDLSFCILLLLKGNIFIFSEVDAVYRVFRKNEGANNFNSQNPVMKRNMMSMELLNNLDRATDKMLDLSMRYALILASSFYALVKKTATKDQYEEVVNCIGQKYKNKKMLLLIKGIIKKVKIAY